MAWAASGALAAAASLAPRAVAAAPYCPVGFRNADSTYLRNTARPASTPFPLGAGAPLGPVTYRVGGETFTLQDYLSRFCVTGFLVLKEDRVVFERYLQGRQPSDALLSASMSKTVFALLVGIAAADGRISLDERVAAVLPDFKDSAFAGASVEDLLRMASGAALELSYERGSMSDNRATNPMVSPHQHVRAYLRDKRDRAAPPGTVFAYNGAQTALLALLLTERLGTTLTAYLESRLWQPMGAEADAYWIKNQRGEEGAQGQFFATLRDYARLGYLVMNGGRVETRQVVPAAWIAQMVELRRDRPQPPAPAPYYGLHVWIPLAAGGRSFFSGTNGQYVFIDPVARVVIVHTGNSPDTRFHGNAHLFALRNAIVRELAGAPRP